MLMRGWPNGPPEALLARLCTAIDQDLAQAECELSERTGQPIVWVRGLGAANESYQVGVGGNFMPLDRIMSDRVAAQRAYDMAGVTPSDIQLVELHDAFVAQLMITMAELGFVELGNAKALIEDGIMADIRELGDTKAPPQGQVLVNPSGGLIFGGHFVGGSNMFNTWGLSGNDQPPDAARTGPRHGRDQRRVRGRDGVGA